ncbi:hypothetical protein CKN80_03775 [Carnobacterium divergens]|uniref:GH-E family nuclease n=1 Tax=Carnobacterium divergens TaxID=2748 RepID=UPI001072D2EE|nr:GH-E family nuclease [Carnobacterium divergens]TFJ46866.1 hypothetical protein CKN79_03770 [Carnobacterium divergens]TFJ53830.1 hypothetical protein CKN80_03775 [Carnobacterium divergens]
MTKIDIGELTNLSSKLNELKAPILTKLSKLETSIAEFDSEEKLKGIAWDTSKKHFTTGYPPITTAFATTLDLISDRLDTYYRSFFIEVTNGHVQLDTDQLQDLLIRMQELSSIKAKWLHDMVDELAGIPGIGKIFNEISLNETKKEVILLQKFQEFESRHSADFDDILETLYYLQTGLDSLGDEKNFLGDQKGFSNSNIVNSPWYKKLTAFNKKHEDEVKLIQKYDAESAAMNAEMTAQILNAQQNLNSMNDAMMNEVNNNSSFTYNPLASKDFPKKETFPYSKPNKKPYMNSRPSYGKNQVNDVWNAAKDPLTNNVYDPTGEVIPWDLSKPRNGQWDMGHIPGQKYSDIHELYVRDIINKQEFLEWYRNPNNYRPELPSTNRGHQYE